MKSTFAFIGLAVVAVLLQVTVLSAYAWNGIAADLALLLTVAVGLARGGAYALACGFGAGLLLDLVPPATHDAGRWTLSLVLVALLASWVRPTSRRAMVGAAVVCSFVGTSVFAMTGLLLGDAMPSFGSMLGAILLGCVWDGAVAAIALPTLVRMFTHLQPHRV